MPSVAAGSSKFGGIIVPRVSSKAASVTPSDAATAAKLGTPGQAPVADKSSNQITTKLTNRLGLNDQAAHILSLPTYFA